MNADQIKEMYPEITRYILEHFYVILDNHSRSFRYHQHSPLFHL